MRYLVKDFNYCELYLTLRCTFGCTYCINGKIARDREELPGKIWVDILNSIEFGNLPLTIGGGEPTLHSDFYEIIQNLKSSIQVDLLTNLSFNVTEFIKNIPKFRFRRGVNPAYKSIRISYHPTKMDPYELISKAVLLQNSGLQVGVFGVSHPENLDYNVMMSEIARENKIYFFIKDFIGEYNGKLFGYFKYPDALDSVSKTANCKVTELLISPDGNIFRCHYHLYNNLQPQGNICDEELEILCNSSECLYYGKCNPCDIKIKTNRFLQMGNCSAEIYPLKLVQPYYE